MRKIFGVISTLLILMGCSSTPKVDIVKEAEVIRNLENEWSAAILNKDLEKSISFTASDAVFMDPNLPAYSGAEAIRKSFETWFADSSLLFNSYSYDIDKIEVSASGELAYVRGHSKITKNTPSGPVDVINKFVDIWKNDNGKWSCILLIGNSDNPIEIK